MASNRFTNRKFNGCLFQSSSRVAARLPSLVYNSKAVLGVKPGMSLSSNHVFYISPGSGEEELMCPFSSHTMCLISQLGLCPQLSSYLALLLIFIFGATILGLIFRRRCVSSRIFLLWSGEIVSGILVISKFLKQYLAS